MRLGSVAKRMVVIVVLIAVWASGCASPAASTPNPAGTVQTTTGTTALSAGVSVGDGITVEWKTSDLNAVYEATSAVAISLNGTGATVNGSGVAVSGNTIRITAAGTYVLTGKLSDGQVVIDAPDDAKLQLVLNGASITSATTAPLQISCADKIVLTLADGTVNTLTDAGTRPAGSEDVDAALFSREDLVINGTGSLVVNGTYRHGIVSKDDLKIVSGTIAVNAVRDGIRGRDMTAIRGGALTITAGSDGIQANNDEDSARGFVYVEGGSVEIEAGADGIQAETVLVIKDGVIKITTGGGSDNASTKIGWGTWNNSAGQTTSTSAKGLKADVNVTIYGGTITIDSSDDAIHSNDTIAIHGGIIDISSGDDGVHADNALVINDGDIYIAKCYEALESASITIRGGRFHLHSSDDGINTAGGNDGSSLGQRPGQNTFGGGTAYNLTIEGGYIYVNSGGDGIDINGNVTMSGGSLIIDGPTAQDNGAIDYNGTFTVTKGTVIAVGSSRMAQSPSSETQGVVSFTVNGQGTGSLIRIEDAAGKELLTFAATKAYQSVVFTSAAVKTGTSYVVYGGGASSGAVNDGVYSGGKYTGGTQLGTVTAGAGGQARRP